MKKTLLALVVLLLVSVAIYAGISTKSYGVENSVLRIKVIPIGEVSGYTYFNWELYDPTDGNKVINSGSGSEAGSVDENYIAQYNSDLHILHIIWEDVED